MSFDFKKYPVLSKLTLEDGSKLVVFSSFHSEEKQFPEILGREVFLLDKNDDMIWQIGQTPKGIAREFDSSIGEFIDKPFDWHFSGLIERDGKILPVRFDGDVFELDMETGKATYVYWTK